MRVAKGAERRRWEEEFERWGYRTRFTLEEVRRAGRAARHNVTAGAGAWYGYVPRSVGARARVLFYRADGTLLSVTAEDPRDGWNHLKGCDCALCAAVREGRPASWPGDLRAADPASPV